VFQERTAGETVKAKRHTPDSVEIQAIAASGLIAARRGDGARQASRGLDRAGIHAGMTWKAIAVRTSFEEQGDRSGASPLTGQPGRGHRP
jgi:hypothetical protein